MTDKSVGHTNRAPQSGIGRATATGGPGLIDLLRRPGGQPARGLKSVRGAVDDVWTARPLFLAITALVTEVVTGPPDLSGHSGSTVDSHNPLTWDDASLVTTP